MNSQTQRKARQEMLEDYIRILVIQAEKEASAANSNFESRLDISRMISSKVSALKITDDEYIPFLTSVSKQLQQRDFEIEIIPKVKRKLFRKGKPWQYIISWHGPVK